MERNGPEQPLLIGQTGPLNGQRWLAGRELLIGREYNCDVIINDRQVSRVHARLEPTAAGVVLEDLASKNGTYVNGRMIKDPTLLHDGDVLQIALVQQLVFLSSDATMPLEVGAPAVARLGRLLLDNRSRRVWVGQEEVLPPLSVPQFRLLQALYDQQGNVVSRQSLVLAVWGEDESVGVSEQALDALVRRLRDRLTSYDPAHAYLVTVRGYGLRLENPPE